jgi:hypothetical protein
MKSMTANVIANTQTRDASKSAEKGIPEIPGRLHNRSST